MVMSATHNPRIRKSELLAAIVLTFAAIGFSSEARSQSFNCSKASRTSEFAICNSENLLLLDEQMASIHAVQLNSRSNRPAKQAFARQSREWLKKRNACKSDFACLELRYRERIRQLSSG